MSIIFLILPITLLLSVTAVVAFAWATRGGQFDDLQTPAIRALHDPISPAPAASPRVHHEPPSRAS
jgi:cbb3-type cytochrome oxidase maturation protein